MVYDQDDGVEGIVIRKARIQGNHLEEVLWYNCATSTHQRVVLSKRVFAIVFVGIVGMLTAACGSSDTATPTPTSLPAATATPTPTSPSPGPDVREIKVTTQDFFFDPSDVGLTPGEKVKFTVTNPTTTFHTFTLALTSGKQQILLDLPMNGGETQSTEFTVPPVAGSLYLFCIPHESIGMTGSVNVGGQGQSLDTSTDDTGDYP